MTYSVLVRLHHGAESHTDYEVRTTAGNIDAAIDQVENLLEVSVGNDVFPHYQIIVTM